MPPEPSAVGLASPESLRAHTATIVSAHMQHNRLTKEELPDFIASIYKALSGLGGPAPTTRPEPAVAPNKSVFQDHVVCLECGKNLKMLKRHLMTDHKLTTDQYRERWGLPASYPMVAPEYASKRSALAKKIGLGRKPGTKVAAAGATAPPIAKKATAKKAGKKAAAAGPKRKPGRPRKMAA
jgi:predicted transcriptional regulator